MQTLSHAKYDGIAITLHWLIALMILAMLALGFFMGDLPVTMKPNAYNFHKSLGLCVLFLSLFRLLWRWLNPPPALPSTVQPLQRAIAHLAHWLLYALIIAMPLSGWLMVSATRKYPTIFFWMGEAPFLPMPRGIDEKMAGETLSNLHEFLAYGALALIALHILAALKHQFVTRDGILSRMLP